MKNFIKQILIKKQIKKWLKENIDIKCCSYYINNDLTIDINGCTIITNYSISEFPYKFNIINGSFICSNCKKLKSLHNSPNIIKKFFDFSYTNIDSYKEGPKEIGGNLYCLGTNIKSMRPWINQIKMNSNSWIYDNEYPNYGCLYKEYIKI